MIAVIRISGDVGLNKAVRETLERLKLRKKYSCRVIESNKVNLGMIKKVRDFVSFGEINKETFEELVGKRGKVIGKAKKIDAKEIVKKFEEKKNFKDLEIRDVFNLHPPRGGIESKKHFGVGKGVLGDNKDKINDLIRRMF